MSEKLEIEKSLIDNIKLEELDITDTELQLIDKTIQDFAPEIAYLYQIREDESEEQRIKTGRLHENRILGILLKFYFEGKKKVTTGEIEEEYKRYFKEIARSTTSTYLNILKKDFTLKTKRDGRIVYYSFKENPPIGIKPFWFTRIFCVVPAYFNRALFFSNLYITAEKNVHKFFKNYGSEDIDILTRNYRFITGLIILNILKNRVSKCVFCQFSKKEIYNKLVERINDAIHDRSDVLSEDLIKNFIEKCSEIPIFNGTDNFDDDIKENIINEISKYANLYKKDLDFQLMVSNRRKNVRLKQEIALEEDKPESSKITNISESIE
ncbi:MAG: hypothetical protein HWN81_13605 [Candidatus Lokiarchaeota archaeon]|nr:hypothetical protein [Candidatus Lokiarchaeota archaeon]